VGTTNAERSVSFPPKGEKKIPVGLFNFEATEGGPNLQGKGPKEEVANISRGEKKSSARPVLHLLAKESGSDERFVRASLGQQGFQGGVHTRDGTARGNPPGAKKRGGNGFRWPITTG